MQIHADIFQKEQETKLYRLLGKYIILQIKLFRYIYIICITIINIYGNRDAEEKIQSGQYDTDRRLGERINDINFWRNEIASELERLVQEIERLNDCNSVLNKAIKDIENPLRIAEECLYYREARKGNTNECNN